MNRINAFFINLWTKFEEKVINVFAGIMFLGLIITLVLTQCSNSGIHAASSGQTVYIAGEACTINMTAEISFEEMRHDFEWCVEKHAKYFPSATVEELKK